MAGHNNWPYIINLGNSIIGVAVLAMPFCFKQCGILLGMLVLLFCTWLTLTSCQLLMRAGIHSRRKSYEFLAYHTHGATGKLLSEVGLIGMQVGTLIAQIVVIGDLGPAIFSKFLGIQNTNGLRTSLIMALCLCVGLPLGLLKDLRAVSRASTVCISFYCIFILYVVGLSLPNIQSGDWYPKVAFWRPEGFFQCLPILSFSFGCQTQLFLLYDALPDPSLKSITGVISSAVNLCAVAYLLVGFFGYVAFYAIDVPGDVISVFPNTFIADLMKICFVFSIVITFPVIIFPCRSSIYTLVFAKKSKPHDDVIDADGYLPERLFKGITIFIVLSCMILGILIPNVEFILGMNGAIMGTLICYIFPALFFLKVMGGKSDGRGIAKVVLVLGITILMVSTYATLSSQGEGGHHVQPLDVKGDDLQLGAHDVDQDQLMKPMATSLVDTLIKDEKKAALEEDARQEPPNPDPPDANPPAVDEKKVEQEDIGKAAADALDVVKREKDGDADGKDVEVVESLKMKEENVKVAEANKAKELELAQKEKKQDELLQELEKHRQEQEKLLEEQRQLLKEFKDHHEQDLKNEQKPVKELQQPVGGPIDVAENPAQQQQGHVAQENQQPLGQVDNLADAQLGMKQQAVLSQVQAEQKQQLQRSQQEQQAQPQQQQQQKFDQQYQDRHQQQAQEKEKLSQANAQPVNQQNEQKLIQQNAQVPVLQVNKAQQFGEHDLPVQVFGDPIDLTDNKKYHQDQGNIKKNEPNLINEHQGEQNAADHIVKRSAVKDTKVGGNDQSLDSDKELSVGKKSDIDLSLSKNIDGDSLMDKEVDHLLKQVNVDEKLKDVKNVRVASKNNEEMRRKLKSLEKR